MPIFAKRIFLGNNILYWQKLGLVFVSFGKITEKCRNAIAHLHHLKPKQPKFSAKIGKKFLPDQAQLSKKIFTSTLRNISLHQLRVTLRAPLRLKAVSLSSYPRLCDSA
ncbi:MAG: hypothetical protein KAF91_31695 [Nostoc sp. TH1S01]|nr:hypothetical protein [Nostoc sp. TH1S01]